jgi:hypothetical protein
MIGAHLPSHLTADGPVINYHTRIIPRGENSKGFNNKEELG